MFWSKAIHIFILFSYYIFCCFFLITFFFITIWMYCNVATIKAPNRIVTVYPSILYSPPIYMMNCVCNRYSRSRCLFCKLDEWGNSVRTIRFHEWLESVQSFIRKLSLFRKFLWNSYVYGNVFVQKKSSLVLWDFYQFDSLC